MKLFNTCLGKTRPRNRDWVAGTISSIFHECWKATAAGSSLYRELWRKATRALMSSLRGWSRFSGDGSHRSLHCLFYINTRQFQLSFVLVILDYHFFVGVVQYTFCFCFFSAKGRERVQRLAPTSLGRTPLCRVVMFDHNDKVSFWFCLFFFSEVISHFLPLCITPEIEHIDLS